jgi:hypothetical protein
MSGPPRQGTSEQFTRLVQEFAGRDGVTLPGEVPSRGFGSDALRIGGSIFSMYVRGKLVVKLPKNRVDILVADGHAEHFSANRGRPMKEWAVLLTDDPKVWTTLAEEALEFVRPIDC